MAPVDRSSSADAAAARRPAAARITGIVGRIRNYFLTGLIVWSGRSPSPSA